MPDPRVVPFRLGPVVTTHILPREEPFAMETFESVHAVDGHPRSLAH